MCIIFATLTCTWPENPADAISEVLNAKIFLRGECLRTLTFCALRSTVNVALPVPEQLPYFVYVTGIWYHLASCNMWVGLMNLICAHSGVVSEPDPRKIEKEGLAYRPGWKCYTAEC